MLESINWKLAKHTDNGTLYDLFANRDYDNIVGHAEKHVANTWRCDVINPESNESESYTFETQRQARDFVNRLYSGEVEFHRIDNGIGAFSGANSVASITRIGKDYFTGSLVDGEEYSAPKMSILLDKLLLSAD